jgi:hypothetical protein
MDSIDVHDLPEDQAQLVAAFVEFLRRRVQQEMLRTDPPVKTPAENPFSSWPLGVKGTLSREEIYEHLG